MTRETFDKQLKAIKGDVLLLGSMVEQAMQEAMSALLARDIEAARKVFFADDKINAKRFEIEHDTLIAIATQQPMAHDLRLLAAVLEIISDLERMGDYAKSVARITVNLGHEPLVKPLIDIPRMAEIGLEMLNQALQAFVDEDTQKARQIPQRDDEVDLLYEQVYRELLTHIMAKPSVMDQANSLLWMAHKLERFTDRVTNICERIVFMTTGQMKEMDLEDEMRKLKN